MRKILFAIGIITSTLLTVASCSDDGGSAPEVINDSDVEISKEKDILRTLIKMSRKPSTIDGMTDKSIKSLKDEIVKAQAVYDKQKSTVFEIKDAIKALEEAKSNLVAIKKTEKSGYIGKWNVSKVFSKNGKITGTMVLTINADVTITGKDYSMKVVFEDKKISNSGSFNVLINVKQVPFLDKSFDKEITKFPSTDVNWTVENNVVKVKRNGKLFTMDVISHSDKKIVVSYPINKLVSEKELLESKGILNGKIKGDIIVELSK